MYTKEQLNKLMANMSDYEKYSRRCNIIERKYKGDIVKISCTFTVESKIENFSVNFKYLDKPLADYLINYYKSQEEYYKNKVTGVTIIDTHDM